MNGEVQAIDWGAPIEAVHTDGRVVAVKAIGLRMRTVEPHLEDNGLCVGFFRSDGTHSNSRIRWRIRNVAKPSVPAPPQGIAPEVVERMAAVIRRDVSGKSVMFDNEVGPNLSVEAEFRAIVALLEPVDPDEAEAAKIAMQNTPETFPTDTCGLAEWVLKGMKAGRSLAAGDGR